MSDWLRRAGRGRLPGGRLVTWTVAEGERGRRWRWTLRAGEVLLWVGLVERRPDGAFARLELASAAGLLTVHPDPDGRQAHGNRATAEGVRPIAVAWQPGWGIGLAGDAFGSAVGGWFGRGLAFDAALAPAPAASVEALPLDERGVPVLEAAQEWPLEE